jgi:hypothetical protein
MQEQEKDTKIKRCSKCKLNRNNFTPKGNICIPCKVEYDKIYKKENKDKIKAEYLRNIEHYRIRNIKNHNPEINRKHNLNNKENKKLWFQKNKKKIYERINYKYHNDVSFRLILNIRTRICQELKKNKSNSSIKYLSCSISKYKLYLESLFTSEMSWENYGIYWEIDHIIPISKFDFSKEEEIYKAFNYKNTQPLTIFENRSKNNNIIR